MNFLVMSLWFKKIENTVARGVVVQQLSFNFLSFLGKVLEKTSPMIKVENPMIPNESFFLNVTLTKITKYIVSQCPSSQQLLSSGEASSFFFSIN